MFSIPSLADAPRVDDFKVFLAFETRLELFTSLCARLLVEQDGFGNRWTVFELVENFFYQLFWQTSEGFFWFFESLLRLSVELKD